MTNEELERLKEIFVTRRECDNTTESINKLANDNARLAVIEHQLKTIMAFDRHRRRGYHDPHQTVSGSINYGLFILQRQTRRACAVHRPRKRDGARRTHHQTPVDYCDYSDSSSGRDERRVDLVRIPVGSRRDGSFAGSGDWQRRRNRIWNGGISIMARVRQTVRTKTRTRKTGGKSGYRKCNVCHGTGRVRK